MSGRWLGTAPRAKWRHKFSELGADNAGKGSGETRTYALLSQPETGKISCVHHLPCARLTPGVSTSNGAIRTLVPSQRRRFGFIPAADCGQSFVCRLVSVASRGKICFAHLRARSACVSQDD